tara:strand:+ start:96 stop:389 length:294 start_codon:yes stop_codon:yes gene_type:complete
MEVEVHLLRYGGVILNSDLKMKEKILQFINKLNIVQRTFLFLLITNIFLGPIILFELGLIENSSLIRVWNSPIGDDYFYHAFNLILICGMLIFKKGS